MIIIKKISIKHQILTFMILFFIISIISIYSAAPDILFKQVIWYLIGFFIIFLSSKINYNKIINYTPILYTIIIVLLFLLLFFGTEINGSKCWFIIPGLGSFQPSEFAKIILIITNAKIFDWYNKSHCNKTLKDDIKLFLIIFSVTLLPSILTFLQPDTGMVIIYFIISFVMLFAYGIKKSIFFTLITLAILFISGFLFFYLNFQNEFINIFGTSFFYRIDRLLDWTSKSGMQLQNATVAIKSAYLFGFGIGNTPIYIPESHTDFIFSVYSSNFGLFGSIILVIIIFMFDYTLLKMAKESNNKMYQFIIIGFLAMIMYQQIQNIAMNIGLLPITGITLPFISYGGSSLISYMLGVAIILGYERTNSIVHQAT